MLIGSGLLIFVGCTLVGYGAVQEEARRGLIRTRHVGAGPAARAYLALLSGGVLLLAGIVALFIGHPVLGFAGIGVGYVGCNLLTYVWGELIAHRGPPPRRGLGPGLERVSRGASPGAAGPETPEAAGEPEGLLLPEEEEG
jgi:hypothetical protein